MNELVRQRLREIVRDHGTLPVSDARLCESLLKDYCGQYKKEIFVLVCAVREQVAADLLMSHDGVPIEMLHTLLTKRLQNNLALTEDASKWAVETWSFAVAGVKSEQVLNEAQRQDELDESSYPSKPAGRRVSLSSQPTRFEGEIIGRCDKAVRSVACAPDGESIVCGSDDSTVRLWNAKTRQLEIVSRYAGPVTSVVFSPDGVCVATANDEVDGSSPRIRIRELETEDVVELGNCSGRSPVVAYSSGGHRLAVGSSETEHSLRIWNLHTGHSRDFRGKACGLSSISFSPVAKIIATGESSLSRAALLLLDLDESQPRTLGYCDRRITGLAFTPDGKHVASGSSDETVRLWNVQTGQMRILGEKCSRINCIAMSRNGEQLAACSLDGRVRLWNVQTAKSRTIGECHGITSVTFSVDGKAIFAGALDGTIRYWPVATVVQSLS